MHPWQQVYDPAGNIWLSSLIASLPILFFFVALTLLRMKGYLAGTLTVALALLVSIFFFRMPIAMALAAAGAGFLFGLWPIAWIIVTAVFLYKITVRTGQFEVIRASVVSITEDQRLQMLLVGFSFGAFLEGAAGFGAPVAITAALLVGLGFNPLYAAGLCLIANTAPVAFGAMGIPILVAGQVTGIDAFKIGAMAGRQLPLLSFLIPSWVILIMDGWRGVRQTWPAILVCGGTFAVTQFLTSNYLGPELPDITSALVSLISLTLFLKFWKPKTIFRFPGQEATHKNGGPLLRSGGQGMVALRHPDRLRHHMVDQALQGALRQGRQSGLDRHQQAGADARQTGDQNAAHHQRPHALRIGLHIRLVVRHRHRNPALGRGQHPGAAHEADGCNQDLRRHSEQH